MKRLLPLFLVSMLGLVSPAQAAYELTILHTNDFHALF